MKLLVLSDGLVYRSKTKYYSHDTFLQFVEEMALHFESLTLCVPVSSETGATGSMGELFTDRQTKINIVETFRYRTVIEYYKKLLAVTMRNILPIWKATKRADIVFLRVPAMNAFLAAALACIHGKPFFCYFVGDEKSVVETGIKYRYVKLKAARAVATFHFHLYKRLVRYSKGSFYLSMDLKRKYGENNKNAFFVFTSLLDDRDIHIEEPRNAVGPVNLLYVGRLSYEKGVEHLIWTVYQLGSGKCRLLVCGNGPDRGRLQNFVNELGLQDHVEFLGLIPWGERLSEVYRKSDILILPSLSEGIPKVLLEAMAKGLPVIATNVGGIPDIIEHMENGILVPPGDSRALANAIRTIEGNEALRQRIVENGYEFAKEHTAEKQAQRITEIIYSHAGIAC